MKEFPRDRSAYSFLKHLLGTESGLGGRLGAAVPARVRSYCSDWRLQAGSCCLHLGVLLGPQAHSRTLAHGVEGWLFAPRSLPSFSFFVDISESGIFSSVKLSFSEPSGHVSKCSKGSLWGLKRPLCPSGFGPAQARRAPPSCEGTPTWAPGALGT